MMHADLSNVPANIATVVTPHNFNRDNNRKMHQVQTSKNSNNVGDKSQKNPPHHSRVSTTSSRSSLTGAFDGAFSSVDFFA